MNLHAVHRSIAFAKPFRTVETDIISQDSEITFRGRGLATLRDGRLLLTVCPLCSQANTPRGTTNGQCAWCAYVPSLADAEPTASTQATADDT